MTVSDTLMSQPLHSSPRNSNYFLKKILMIVNLSSLGKYKLMNAISKKHRYRRYRSEIFAYAIYMQIFYSISYYASRLCHANLYVP